MCPERYGFLKVKTSVKTIPQYLCGYWEFIENLKRALFLGSFFSTDTNCIRVRCSVRVCGKNSIRKVHVLGFRSLSISIEDFFDRGFGF